VHDPYFFTTIAIGYLRRINLIRMTK